MVFANHKGGCAKTTSVGNVGCALSSLGRRVLLVDCDPQANLTELFGGEDLQPRLEDALAERVDPAAVVHRERVDEAGAVAALAAGVSLIPCGDALADVIAEGVPAGEWALRELLDQAADGFDVVLIDTPPGLGPLSSMAMLAARWVIVPARPADFDVSGAIKLADLIDSELCHFNPDLQLLGVLVCQTSQRWTLNTETTEALKEAGIKRLAVDIPFAVGVGRAPRQAAPTILTDPKGRVADAYRRLATDLDTALLG